MVYVVTLSLSSVPCRVTAPEDGSTEKSVSVASPEIINFHARLGIQDPGNIKTTYL